jgi:hypothetical protein
VVLREHAYFAADDKPTVKKNAEICMAVHLFGNKSAEISNPSL